MDDFMAHPRLALLVANLRAFYAQQACHGRHCHFGRKSQ
jgi:hypothetical protein